MIRTDKTDEWLAALRSGDWRQGRARLRTHGSTATLGDHRYCCLGVAAELGGEFADLTLTYATYLPEDVARTYGITSVDEQHLLGSLNDHGVTFTEIADAIERDVAGEETLRQTTSRLAG